MPRLTTALSFALTLTGCLDHTLPPTEAGEIQGPFIAFQRDFLGFERWQAFAIDADAHLADARDRTLYLSQRPSAGAKVFPVGTIIVKVLGADGPPEDQIIHAMAKRGAGFNPTGAVGWEWFELRQDSETNTPVILWRGERPPDGEGYALPGGVEVTESDCNDCHRSPDNDAVLAPPLNLENF
jgi:hypothetical protein